ncbi:MAG: hypothetical protein A3F72_06410 [Bacteroidetes bacterium RIFCSPLOWO2_12_FULL_35_15]|nr:MAG: hypothetical protein A3F72_06410 [Bacteroidetes bacterium RIFCSPLOWO2_12_FULL_35_15]
MKKLFFILSLSIACQTLFAQTYTVPSTGTNSVTTCGGTVYDHAGTGIYSNSANGTLTIYPATAGAYVSLSFVSFSTESGYDNLRIYDGTSTAATMIGSWTGSALPGNIYATNASGALTLNFSTDGSITYDGFAATISCVTSVPLSDLIIQSQSVTTTSIVGGGSSTINYTVKNQGGTTAASNYTGFYLSTNNQWDASDVYLSNLSVSSLSSGLTSAQNSTITIPLSTPNGSYYILFKADYTGIINEAVETNNISSFPITVTTAVIDLYVNNVSLSSSTVAAGTSVSASCYVYNQGNTIAPSSSLGYYLSTNLVFDISDVFLSSTSTSTISPGYYYYASATLNIPSGTAPGNYYILYFADYPNTISESNEQNNINAISLAVTGSGKDLSIVSASATPNSIAYGLSTSFYFTSLNQSYQTTTTSVGFYLSTDSIFDVADTYLTYTTSSISANSFGSGSPTLTIPSNTTPGSYYILSFIDYTNSITETNENNNILATHVTITTPLVDLLIQTPTLSATSVAAGVSVSATCYINNVGNSTSSSSSVGFYLSTDAIFDAADTYLNYYSGGALAASGSSYRSATLTIPSGTTPGNYYILYYADYTNQVTETNETNNVNNLAITIIAPVIDLTITSQNNPASAASGGSISIYCYINNIGSTVSTYSNVGFYLSTDAIFDAGDTYLNSYAGGTLAAGTSSYRGVTATIPPATPNGNYYILYYADYTSQVSESVETNNVASLPITIAPSFVDLTITSPSNPATATAGNSIATSCYIYNSGNLSATYSNVGYYLSTDAVFDAGDTYLSYYSGSSLSAGASSYKSISLTIPLSTPNGNYYILYYADYSNQVTESNEGNNVIAIPITIGLSAGTDLVIQSGNTISPSSTVQGGNITATCYIANIGGTASASSNVGYYLSVDSIWDASDTYLNYYTGGALNGGISSYKSITLTIPLSTTVGNYYILFYADYSNSVAETIETNNVRRNTLAVVSSTTDLLINTQATGSGSVAAGGSISSSCYILNQGSASASSSNVGYYLSTDSVWSVSDTYLNYYSGGAMAAGASSYRSSTLTIPVGTTPGNYYLLFYADYSNMVNETVETNNVKWTALTVTASSIDLVINSQTLSSSSVAAGTSISSTCYIFNQGNTSAVSSNVGYYLSTDSIWDGSDTYLNSYAGGTLGAGASSYRSTALVIPSSTTAGNYYIIFFADYSNSVSETVETNNKKFLPIQIVAPIIDLSIVNYYLSSAIVAKGATVTAYCYIFNQGNTSSSLSNVGYYLSIDSLWDASDVYLNSYAGGALAANSYSTRPSVVTIPSGTSTGNYFVLYYADYSSQVAETNENNNVVSTRISVTNPSIDLLTLAPYVSNANIVTGTSVSVGATMFNTGNILASSSNIGFYLSIDSLFDASDTYLNYLSGSSLNGGASSLRSTSITIPTSTTPGNYYILYYADYSSMVAENNETNNVNFYRISVVSSYIDLFVQTPSLSASTALPGTYVTAYSYLYNQGNMVASYSYTGYYLSTDTIWSASDVYLTSYSGGSLAPNTSSYRSSSLLIPSSTTNGNYYILFYADYAAYVTENIETNNVSYVPITIGSPFIDLTITNASATPLSTTAGATVAVSCTINNAGTASSTVSTVGYYLSTNNSWDAADTYLNYSAGTTLAAGSNSYKSANITIPVSTTPGTYYILYYADYSNGAVESTETNNVAYLQISVVASSSDLIIQNPSLSPSTVPAGDTVSVSCDIFNQGNIAAYISSVGYYLSANPIYNASDVFLGYQSGGALSISNGSQRNKTLTIPLSTIPGTYYLLFFADYLDAEVENNENNNILYLPITIDAATSVQDNNSETDPVVTLFPNPATDFVNLVIENINENTILIELMDITGKCISTENVKNYSGKKIEKAINIKDISSGIYFLKVSTEKTMSVKKVVIN